MVLRFHRFASNMHSPYQINIVSHWQNVKNIMNYHFVQNNDQQIAIYLLQMIIEPKKLIIFDDLLNFSAHVVVFVTEWHEFFNTLLYVNAF